MASELWDFGKSYARQIAEYLEWAAMRGVSHAEARRVLSDHWDIDSAKEAVLRTRPPR